MAPENKKGETKMNTLKTMIQLPTSSEGRNRNGLDSLKKETPMKKHLDNIPLIFKHEKYVSHKLLFRW
jgi:hypothetical protein